MRREAKLAKQQAKQEAKIAQQRAKQESEQEAVTWCLLQQQFNKIRVEWFEAESDPRTILIRPMILDLSWLYTRNFHTSMKHADDVLGVRRNLSEAKEAVRNLQQDWEKLWNRANALGIPGLSEEQRQCAFTLLDCILDETREQGERKSAHTLLAKIIKKSGLVVDVKRSLVKRTSQLSLKTGSRPALPR